MRLGQRDNSHSISEDSANMVYRQGSMICRGGNIDNRSKSRWSLDRMT